MYCQRGTRTHINALDEFSLIRTKLHYLQSSNHHRKKKDKKESKEVFHNIIYYLAMDK